PLYHAATRRSSRGTYSSTLQSRGAQTGRLPGCLAWRATLGSTPALACPFRRLGAMFCRGKVRDGEGAIASTRGACAPQKEATVPSRFNCGACYLALLTLTRHLLRGNQLKKDLEFTKSLLK